MSGIFPIPRGGGGTPKGLPIWTHVAGGSTTPADGTFTTDTDDIDATVTFFFFSKTPKNGEALFGNNLRYIGLAMAFITEVEDGGTIGFVVTSAAAGSGGDGSVIGGHFAYPYAGNWDGDYIFSFAPGVVTVPTFDTGWSANESAGDKTVVVPNYAGGGALAGLDATADAQIVALTKKLQALEATMTVYQFPNA